MLTGLFWRARDTLARFFLRKRCSCHSPSATATAYAAINRMTWQPLATTLPERQACGKAAPVLVLLRSADRGVAMVLSGGCLCGAVRFTATGKPDFPHGCSCRMCQRHSGAPVLVWVSYPAAAVQWAGPHGAPALWRSSDISSRAFCPVCGSTLGAVDDAGTIGLVTGAFDRVSLQALSPVSHSYKSARPRWWARLFTA